MKGFIFIMCFISHSILSNAQNTYQTKTYTGAYINISTGKKNNSRNTTCKYSSTPDNNRAKVKDSYNNIEYEIKYDTVQYGSNHYIAKTIHTEQCYLCKGNGICTFCKGTGYSDCKKTSFAPMVQCSYCSVYATLGWTSIGRCKECLGSGKRTTEIGVFHPEMYSYCEVTAMGKVLYHNTNVPIHIPSSNHQAYSTQQNNNVQYIRCNNCCGTGWIPDYSPFSCGLDDNSDIACKKCGMHHEKTRRHAFCEICNHKGVVPLR